MDWLSLTIACGLVLLNGFFVATEFAIVKVRPTRIEALLQRRSRRAASARQVLSNIDGYLSATQLGVTLASLGLGWLGEPAFSRLLAVLLGHMGLSDPVWLHRITLATAFVTISFLHIVVGELVPKSIAIRMAEPVTLAVAVPMRAIYILLYPAIHVLGAVSNATLRLMGLAPDATEQQHSEEEIRIILNQARSAGLLGASRSELLSKVLVLPNKTASHLMVPRNEVVLLDTNQSVEDNLARAMQSGHARFPLCNRELDEVLGVIDVRDILIAQRTGPIDLTALARPLPYFPELMGAERLLTEFRTRRATMAVVVDEYGGAAGIVTPADVVAAVMGDLEEEPEQGVQPLPGGAFLVEGTTPLEELSERLATRIDSPNVRTVAGFLMEQLGRMPKADDRIFAHGYVFFIDEMDGPRVRRVRIMRQERPGKRGAETPSHPTTPRPS